MAPEKVSTIILKVDLDCHKCNKKIRAVLCKLQGRYNIETIVYDEKKNTVTLTGPFCPHRLAKKLCCKACKVIREIEIVDPPKPEPPKPAPPKPEPPKPEPPKPEPPKPEPPKPEPPKPEPPKPEPPKPEPPKPEPPKPQPPKPEPPKPEPPKPCYFLPVWPVWPAGSEPVCWRPCGDVCTCGRRCSEPPPPPPPAYDRPCCDGGYKVEFFTDQDQGCRIM
ncbi:hypothetical protein QJS04_geneDACA018330 [Acorus gramineus]|uniref:HMA domain-containing protein n=1 Tax=Acorus gramineus TaxID=55184 RepID=A0AAV9BCP1_ACOGR|nr:hypothetical protein QJS04_geneDACA018330 [Acorus gramineus]